MRVLGFHLHLVTTDQLAAVRASGIDEGERKVGHIVRRYAHNPTMLRAAVAAHCGLSSVRHIDPGSMLLPPMQAAIEAFGKELERERGE